MSEYLRTWENEKLGPIKTPECEYCLRVKKVDTEKLKPHPTRDEWEYTVTCHGDTQIYHMSRQFLDLMREAKKQMEFLHPDQKGNIKLGVPDAFNPFNSRRINGVRHLDCMAVACQMFGMETPNEEEQEAKKKFQHDFKKEKEKGNVSKTKSK